MWREGDCERGGEEGSALRVWVCCSITDTRRLPIQTHQRLLDDVQPPLGLVDGRGLAPADLVGLPQRRDLPDQVLDHLALLKLGQVRAVLLLR